VTATEPRRWWQDALVYQVYVRSFADSNGDGVGDLDGIRQHLDHIASLGTQAIWLNPCYPSPQRDHGYDVADYFEIHHEYGTLAIFDTLVTEARRRDLRVIMDIVPNHCSEGHPWFAAAVDAAPGSPERARFYFRDGRGPDGTEPPNNWQAAFGGSAWTRVNDRADDGQWYLGTFTPYQPDFDHTNPDVQAMFQDVLTFWFDRGVDGFRVDAISPLGKDPRLPDQPPVGPDVGVLQITWANPYTVFRDEGHTVWRQWRAAVNRYELTHPDRDLMLVAEAYTARRPDLTKAFTRPDEFHQMFAFDVMLSPWHKQSLERSLREPLKVLAETAMAPAWTLNNHDTQRVVTRLGHKGADDPTAWTGNNLLVIDDDIDLDIGTRRARALIALVFALPGSLYLYQGEELGLPEVLEIPDARRQDPVFYLAHGAGKGRDGCRVPLPWTGDPATAFGFSPGGGEPWLPQPANWGDYALTHQTADSGLLAMYRTLAGVRRRHAVTQPLAATVLRLPAGLVGVRRGSLSVLMNLTDSPLPVPAIGALADRVPVFATDTNDVAATGRLPPWSTVWFDKY
jgi:alpha-glucosidase